MTDTVEPVQASVLGLPIHLCDDFAGWLQERMEASAGTHVVTLNSEMAMLARQNSELAAAIRQADLVIPDGSGVVFYLRLRGILQARCAGIELAAEAVARLARLPAPHSVFFYGGMPGRAAAAARYWQQQYPQLEIGVQHGYIASERQAEFLEDLRARQPRLILVGLGVPRQESWIVRHRHLCPSATWIGVGGSFDIWAGAKSRAPGWMSNIHLEWLYRLYREPWRWRRMLVLPHFAFKSIIER
nr:WecB/TagA/CpsF family glycosyltransferase [Rubidibacter lacunae]